MDTQKNDWMFSSLSGATALAFFSDIKGRIDETLPKRKFGNKHMDMGIQIFFTAKMARLEEVMKHFRGFGNRHNCHIGCLEINIIYV